MSTKSEKSPPKLKSGAASTATGIDPYKKLLARVAGNVAAGIVKAPSPRATTASDVAAIAVDIATEILRAAGIEA